MAASAEIYFEHDRWGRALAWSAGFHVGITVLLLVYSAVAYRTSGEGWGAGGGGEAMGVSLVSTSSAVSEFSECEKRSGE